MNDPVNHPAHYNQSGIKCQCGRQIECIDVTRHQNFNIGNVMKYIWRYGFKNGLEDLKKAAWYLSDEISQLEKSKKPKLPKKPQRLPEEQFFALNHVADGLEAALANKLSAGMAQTKCHACGCAHAGYTCEEYLTRSCHEHQ